MFKVPFTRLNYRKHTVRYYVPEIWNNLSAVCNLVKDAKISTLKEEVKKHLLQNQ